MAVSGEESEENQSPALEIPVIDDDEEDDDEEDFEDDDEEDDDDDDDEDTVTDESENMSDRAKMESLFRLISTTSVPLRVHDVLIQGNYKTKESLIKAEIDALKTATSVQELLQAASIANARLQRLEIFDSVNITLDSGPPELPGTTNVIVEVVEANKPLTCDIGIFSKPEARAWSFEGSLKLKNLFGYGDLWDASLVPGWEQMSEVTAGVSLPRFKGLVTPITARVSLLSQDWLKFSSYKEQSVGLSLGLISTNNHDLACNFSWRTLTDPSQMSSTSVRRQLGHDLNSAMKYTFKIDKRNSPLRPTRGFAFVSSSQFGGLVPDYRSLRFFRQEFDLRCAIPLGFYRAALNLGIASGIIFPWGNEFLNQPSYLPDRFFLGGNSSPVCRLGGPTSLLGFKSRGLGPTEPRREADNSSVRDYLGGDLAVTAFADLSFDLPLRVLRESGIHGHAFACAGSLNKVTEKAFQDLTYQKFLYSFRSSVGFGIIVPTRLFRMEANYCYILKKQEHDQAKTGVQFSFSSPL